MKSENLNDISGHYKKHNDLKSLRKLVKTLKKGMAEEEVVRMLEEPVYSHVESQFYYGL